MGEVIVEGSNLYGDEFNLVARLEAFCQPGEFFLSKAVHEFVSKKVEFSFSDLGDQLVKNTIVHAFDLMIAGIAQRDDFEQNFWLDSEK